MKFAWSVPLMTIVAAALLPGCSPSLNSEVGSLDGPLLPALDPDTPSLIADDPSVRDLDRRDWPVVTIAVPTRQTEHYPAWIRTRNWLLHQTELGEYPTALTALATEHEAATMAGEAAVELLALPVGYIINAIESSRDGGPFAIDRSPRPDESFERRPEPQSNDAGRWVADTPQP